MATTADGLESLGSLAQSARSKHLKSARTTLIVIGVLTFLVNAGLGIFGDVVVDAAFKKELQNVPAGQIDQAKLAELKKQALATVHLSAIGFAGLGVVFIVLGLFVYKAPVVCTALGLVLYLGGWALDAMADPTMIAKGIILKIIIIVALGKALRAAIEYQKENAAALKAV